MTADEISSGRSGIKSASRYLWHPIAIAFLLVASYLGTNILAQLPNPDGPVHGDISWEMVSILILTFVLIVAETVGVGIALYRRDMTRALWQFLAVVLLMTSLAWARPIGWAVQYANLLMFSRIFQACEQNAQPYDGERLNICNAQSFGSSFRVVVFDSGGEIGRPAPQRSDSFKNALKAQKSPLLSDCKIAAGTKLRGSFYLVDSECD